MSEPLLNPHPQGIVSSFPVTHGEDPGCTYSRLHLSAHLSPIQGCCPPPPPSLRHHQLSTLLDLLYHIKMLSPALTEKNKQNTDHTHFLCQLFAFPHLSFLLTSHRLS